VTLPGFPAIFFLVYLLVLLPWLAFRSHRLLRATTAGNATLPPRSAIWINTLMSQVLMLILAWLIAGMIGYPLFQVPALGVRELTAGAVALAVYFLLRKVIASMRSEEERRRLFVYLIAPRTPTEWLLSTATVLAAAVAEEAAYRGVGMAILWYTLDNGLVAAGIASLAFALAHGTQGTKSMVIIFFMALVMHGLVWYTGTLVVAMAVHAAYDFVAGYLIAREARTFDATASAAAIESD
jgi:membrane protease YdiL (CAAX protease family)